jgi:predicted PurR-regulated permease PerM
MQQDLKIKPIISTLILIIGIFSVIIMLGKVLIPFLIALILSYIVNPFVEKIQNKFKIKRSILSFIIAILVFLLFVSIPIFILPDALIQIKFIIKEIPSLIHLINDKLLLNINGKYGTNFTLDYDNVKALLVSNIGTLYNHVNLFSPIAHNSIIFILLN